MEDDVQTYSALSGSSSPAYESGSDSDSGPLWPHFINHDEDISEREQIARMVVSELYSPFYVADTYRDFGPVLHVLGEYLEQCKFFLKLITMSFMFVHSWRRLLLFIYWIRNHIPEIEFVAEI